MNNSGAAIEQSVGEILFIEDDTPNRAQGLLALQRKNYKNIIAPNSRIECEELLTTRRFKGAIVDYYLTRWINLSNDEAIVLGRQRCFNGIEVAEYLLSKDDKIEIGLFSSNEIQLETQVKQSKIYGKVKIISQKNPPKGDINWFLPLFVQNTFHKVNVQVLPAHASDTVIPQDAEFYFTRKLLHSTTKKKAYWSLRDCRWVVGINEDIKLEIEKVNAELTARGFSKNETKDYVLGLDSDDYSVIQFVERFEAHTRTIAADLLRDSIQNESFADFMAPFWGSTFHEMVVTYFLARLYARHDELKSQVIQCLKQFPAATHLEISKAFIVEGLRGKMVNGETLPDYQLLLTQAGMPQVLDVFTGAVDSMNNTFAAVKLQSAVTDSTRVEQLPIKAATEYGLSPNCQFQYTIFKVKNGVGSEFSKL